MTFAAPTTALRGKGGKDRRIPIEPALVDILERYLDTRAARFPAAAKRRSSPGGGLAAWPAAAPLFVGADGERITRGTLQYRVLRAFRRAGIDADRARGDLAALRQCRRHRDPHCRSPKHALRLVPEQLHQGVDADIGVGQLGGEGVADAACPQKNTRTCSVDSPAEAVPQPEVRD